MAEQLDLAPMGKRMRANRAELAANRYPGRVAVMGLSSDSTKAIQVYALTGRSEPSRNRIFLQEGNSVRTAAPDVTPEQMAATENAALIYYPAFANKKGVHVVSNGAQTWGVLHNLANDKTLRVASWRAGKIDDVDLSLYEPDPSNTPRITGVIDLREAAPTPFGLLVIRKDPDSDHAIYSDYEIPSVKELKPGVGYGIRTYLGDGDPLPSFDQEPFALPLGAGATDTLSMMWDSLNQVNRVALAVRAIDLVSGLTQTSIHNGRA